MLNSLLKISFTFILLVTLSACGEPDSSISGTINGSGKNGNNVIEGIVIDIGDEWLYRKGTSAPPSDWISVGFDDSSWLAGNTGIGYGDGDDATVLSDMSGNYATVYTRKVINYDGSININSLALEIDYDDGFVAYINGQEVARANMPAGQPSFDTLASTGRESGTAVLFNLDGFISLISNGDNVLAIEIHNDRLTSSDLSFLPRLLVNVEELPPTVFLSASPTSVVMNGSTTLNWNSTNTTTCTGSGAWSGTMATSGSQTINALTANSSFNLSCSGAGGSVNDSVIVTVAALSAPTLSFSASPSTVPQNGSTTLNWSSTDATSCTASGGWSGSKGMSGSETISSLTTDTQFTLICSGVSGSVNEIVNVAVVMNGNGVALLSWLPPTENTDGSPLTDLAGYKIYYGTTPGNYGIPITINNPGLSSYLVENLAVSDWHFVISSFNSSGIESSYSTEVSKTIN